MVRALLDNIGKHVSGDGAWWILGMNGILLIPLIFSAFFYPREILTGAAAALALTVAALVVSWVVRARAGTRERADLRVAGRPEGRPQLL